MFIAKFNDLIILARETREEIEQDIGLMVYTSIEETDIEYKLYNGKYLTPLEIKEKEKEHIKTLTCTKRVFALMLQELGVDYISQLKPLIESNPQAQLEWDLCIELLRENPMLDLMASKLGITSEQLDALFLYANGEITEEDFKSYKEEEIIESEDIDNEEE